MDAVARRGQAGAEVDARDIDAVLELGLQSQLGRTLEMTSTVAVEVEVAPATAEV